MRFSCGLGINHPERHGPRLERQLLQPTGDPARILGQLHQRDAIPAGAGPAECSRSIARDEASQPNGVSGSRLDAPSRVLLGRSTNDPALPAYLVLVDSSTSYYQATAFDNSVGQLAGRTWTYPKTGQISGAGLPTFGYKIMGLRTIQSLPNATLGLEKSELDALAKNHTMHQASASAQFDGESPGEVMIGEKSVSVDALRAIFQQMEDGLR